MQTIPTTQFQDNPTRLLVSLGSEPRVLIIAADLGQELAAQPLAETIRNIVKLAMVRTEEAAS